MRSLIHKISVKQFMWFAILLFVASVIPLFMLGRYNVMRADDYSYGIDVYNIWRQTGSVWEVIKCAAGTVKRTYLTWQGTYSAHFMTAVCPMHFCVESGFMVPVLMIGSLSAGTYLLGRQIFVRWLQWDKKSYMYVACMLLFLFWQVIDTPCDGIYWYNGATAYILMQGVMFLMLAAVSGIIWTERKRNERAWCVLASFAGLFVGGGNLVTGLQAQIILVLLLLYVFINNRKKMVYITIPLVCFTLGFLINILSPGNAMRGNMFVEARCGVIESIMLSFYNALAYMGEWTSLIVVLVWLSVAPVMWCAARDSQNEFKYPGLVTVGVYCSISAMFTPTLFAMGEVGISRINNIIQIVYYLGLFAVTSYWFGWFTHRAEYKKKYGSYNEKVDLIGQHGNVIVVAALAAVMMVWIFTVDKNTYTGISALRSIVKGDAQTFYEEEMERREMLLDDEMSYVIVDVHTARPHLFSDIDLSWDADYWINQAVAHYFHKKKVVRRVE